MPRHGGCRKPQFDFEGHLLTAKQIAIIEAYRRHPGATQVAISKIAGCKPNHVSETLQRWATGDMGSPHRVETPLYGKPAQRACLRCGKLFQSEHAGHRFCGCPEGFDDLDAIPDEEYAVGGV